MNSGVLKYREVQTSIYRYHLAAL